MADIITTDAKPWYQSKTIWGGVVAFLAVVGGLFGVDVDEAQKSVLVEALVGLGGVIGLILTIWGRAKAEKSIGKAK
jgi:Mg2+ and Co2+ transporter CorA